MILFGTSGHSTLLAYIAISRQSLRCSRKSPPSKKGDGATVRGTQHLKESVQTILSEAQFELHKWHSNVPALETDTLQEEKISEQESSYAKQQLGEKPGETKLLGMPWEKEKDTIAVVFPTQPLEPTKRELLGSLARIYDPLGLASSTILEGKVLYREVCDSRLA